MTSWAEYAVIAGPWMVWVPLSLPSTTPMGVSSPLGPRCACWAGWLAVQGRGSPVGGDGFSQAVQVVEVVVCGEELAAGGTDRSCLQGPANHP